MYRKMKDLGSGNVSSHDPEHLNTIATSLYQTPWAEMNKED